MQTGFNMFRSMVLVLGMKEECVCWGVGVERWTEIRTLSNLELRGLNLWLEDAKHLNPPTPGYRFGIIFRSQF